MNNLSESSKDSVREFMIDSMPNIEERARLVIFDPVSLDYMDNADEVYEYALNELNYRIENCQTIIDEVKEEKTPTLVMNKQLEQFQIKKQLCALKEVKSVGKSKIKPVDLECSKLMGSRFKLDWHILSLIIRNLNNSELGDSKYIDFDFTILSYLLNELSETDRCVAREYLTDSMTSIEKRSDLVIYEPDCLDYMADAKAVYQRAVLELNYRIELCKQMIAEIQSSQTCILVLNKQLDIYQLGQQLSKLNEKKKQLDIADYDIMAEGNINQRNRW